MGCCAPCCAVKLCRFTHFLGTSPNPLISSTTVGLETNKKGCLIATEQGATTKDAVYAGGDAVTGAATVILAMGAGKTAAAAIDEYFKNK